MKTEDKISMRAEEDSAPVRAIDLLYSVFFIGILLTFAIYVSVTMLLGAQTSIAEQYRDGSDHHMPLSSYNDAYYKNSDLQTLITQYDYELFGKIEDKNILVGRENFLFEVAREDNGYNYLRDFLGEYAYDADALENIYNSVSLRRTAYRNRGIEYMLVVIPNAQTVYTEYLPSYIQDEAGKTRLRQLSEYMRTKDDITFIDLTDAFIAAKSAGKLYNNTEDSLNSLGQYFVYQTLYKIFPEQVKAGTRMLNFDEVTLYTHHTDGKTLARAAGIASVVKNETISLSNSMEFNYLLQELYPAVEVTYADHSGGMGAGQTVLLEFSNEWDKIQLMPYFSTTFDDAVYKSDHRFNPETLDTAQPSLVIQFIHEYELSSLTDTDTAQTYHDGLKDVENPYTTVAPIVTHQLWLDEKTVCLTGVVETGARLTISGDAADVRTMTANEDDTIFITLIEMGDEEEVVVRLQASVADKNRSKVTKVTITRGEEKITPVTSVTVGSESRIFLTDSSHTILPDTGTMSVLRSELRTFTERIRERSFLKDTEFINVVIPQSASVYADCAPEGLRETLEKAEEYRAVIQELYESCGWTVLDLTEDLRENRDIGKLYGLTFDRWTDYGAYVGYRSLIEHIRQDFPQIAATELSEYTRVTQITESGELATMLGLAPTDISETLVHLRLNSSKVSYDQSGSNEVDLSDTFFTMVSDYSLPIAIVIRDEAGTEMLESMAQHFRIMIVLAEGETEIDDQTLTLFEPDYIIRLSGEATPGLYDMVADQDS